MQETMVHLWSFWWHGRFVWSKNAWLHFSCSITCTMVRICNIVMILKMFITPLISYTASSTLPDEQHSVTWGLKVDQGTASWTQQENLLPEQQYNQLWHLLLLEQKRSPWLLGVARNDPSTHRLLGLDHQLVVASIGQDTRFVRL